MKIDKNKLLQDIEEMKEKLAAMEEQLNKPDGYRHFPGNGGEYYYYTSAGTLCRNTAEDYKLKVNVYRTENEAQKAYNKAVAVEKIKIRLLELQGDWKPDFNDDSSKYTICYNYIVNSFTDEEWQRFKHYCVLIPYMENKEIALTIINEFNEELKLIFDIQ